MLLIVHTAGVASPTYTVHDWTISTFIGEFGFAEIGRAMPDPKTGQLPDTDRFFYFGPFGHTRTSLHSSSVRIAGYAVGIVVFALLAWAITLWLQKKRHHEPRAA